MNLYVILVQNLSLSSYTHKSLYTHLYTTKIRKHISNCNALRDIYKIHQKLTSNPCPWPGWHTAAGAGASGRNNQTWRQRRERVVGTWGSNKLGALEASGLDRVSPRPIHYRGHLLRLRWTDLAYAMDMATFN
jgi:hypothetical protein